MASYQKRFCLPRFSSQVFKEAKRKTSKQNYFEILHCTEWHFVPLRSIPLAKWKKLLSSGNRPESARVPARAVEPTTPPSAPPVLHKPHSAVLFGVENTYSDSTHVLRWVSQVYTRRFRFTSIWIKEKKSFWNACRESERQVRLLSGTPEPLRSTCFDFQPWNCDISLCVCHRPQCLVCGRHS